MNTVIKHPPEIELLNRLLHTATCCNGFVCGMLRQSRTRINNEKTEAIFGDPACLQFKKGKHQCSHFRLFSEGTPCHVQGKLRAMSFSQRGRCRFSYSNVFVSMQATSKSISAALRYVKNSARAPQNQQSWRRNPKLDRSTQWPSIHSLSVCQGSRPYHRACTTHGRSPVAFALGNVVKIAL